MLTFGGGGGGGGDKLLARRPSSHPMDGHFSAR